MRTSVLRRVALGLASTAVVTGVAGCGSDVGNPTGATAFVVGARSNMPVPELDGRALDAMKETVENQSFAAIIVADGEPSVVDKKQLTIDGATGTAQDADRADNERWIAERITGARADDEETDLLTALSLAARTIRSVETGSQTIVVVDSGLSTVAPLDFSQPGMLDAEPQDVVDSLTSADALPDLSGITVVVQGLGDTAPPQDELTIAQRKNLLEIWQAVLTAAGADEVVIEESPLEKPPADDLPDVSVVALPEPRVCTPNTVVLSSGDVVFLPNSAQFRDAAAAEAVIEPVAEQLRDGGFTATVTGMTARVGDDEGQVELSRDRAQAVADVLIDKGVAPDAVLRVDGVGSHFPGYVEDHDGAGVLIPAAAAANRKVEIQLTGGGSFDC